MQKKIIAISKIGFYFREMMRERESEKKWKINSEISLKNTLGVDKNNSIRGQNVARLMPVADVINKSTA